MEIKHNTHCTKSSQMLMLNLPDDTYEDDIVIYINNINNPQVCCGHFVVANNVRRWYEVYMSPNSSHIVLRPDVRYHFQAIISYEIQVFSLSS